MTFAIVVLDTATGNIVAGFSESAPLGTEVSELLATPADRPRTASAKAAEPEPRPPEAIVAPAAPQAPATPIQESQARSVPRTGTLVWSAKINKGAIVVVQGSSASFGDVSGELPGVPVALRFPEGNFILDTPPSAATGWRTFRLRSVAGGKLTIAIRWTENVQ